MTKEQLLEQLKEINDLMEKDEIIQLNNSNEEYKKLEDKKEVLKQQISELEFKISDDSNYPVFDFILNKSKLDKIKKSINKLNLKLEQNETTVSDNTTRIKEIDINIGLCNEQIIEAEQQIDEVGKKLRSLGENPDKKLNDQYSLELSQKRDTLNELRTELATYTTEREDLTNEITSITNGNKSISANIEKYQALEASINERENSNQVDTDKKSKDEQRLEELKSDLKILEDKMEYAKTDVQEDVNVLMAEIETDSISGDEIISKINVIKEKLPNSLIETDYEKYESELEDNNLKQALLISDISSLQTKLDDSTNYTPSIMAIEVMNDEISNMELKISDQEDEIKYSEYLISTYYSSISNNEDVIASEESKIEKIQQANDEIKFRMTDATLSTKDYDELSKQYNKNRKEIENSRKQIDRLSKNISTIETLISTTKKHKKEVENMKISDTKILNAQKESLEDRKTVDRLSMLKDQEKLAALNAELSALKAKEEILNFAYYEKIDNIIKNFDPTKVEEKAVETTEVVEPTETKEIEKEETKDEVASEVIVEPTESEKTEESKDEEAKDEEVETTVVAPIVTENENEVEAGEVVVDPAEVQEIMEEEKSNNGAIADGERIFFDEARYKEGAERYTPENAQNLGLVVDPLIAEEEDSKKLPIAIVGWKNAPKSLIEKVKNSDFIKKLKKRLIQTGIALVATVALLSSLKGCNNGKQNINPNEIVQTQMPTDSDEKETKAEVPTEDNTEVPTETKEETPTEAPTEASTEAPTEDVVITSIEAQVDGVHYVGETLSPEDFTVIVNYSDDTNILNPEGWTASTFDLTNEGVNPIEVSYEGFSTVVDVVAQPVIVTSIDVQVSGIHYVGDVLSPADFTVTVNYSNGNTLVNPEGWTASTFELTNEGLNPIVVSYDGFSTVVNVNAEKRKVYPTEIRAELTGDGKYYTGTILEDSNFKVELVMSDGSVVENPEGWTTSTRIIANAGDNPITISYLTEDNRLLTTTVVAKGMLKVPEKIPVQKPETPDKPTQPDTPDKPNQEEEKPTVNVTLKPGETLIVPEKNGDKVAVDNSDMENSDVIADKIGDVNYDYPQSEEIGDVKWNEDGSTNITINKPETPEKPVENPNYSSNLSKEEQAYLDAFLQEQKEALEKDSKEKSTTEQKQTAPEEKPTEEPTKGKSR